MVKWHFQTRGKNDEKNVVVSFSLNVQFEFYFHEKTKFLVQNILTFLLFKPYELFWIFMTRKIMVLSEKCMKLFETFNLWKISKNLVDLFIYFFESSAACKIFTRFLDLTKRNFLAFLTKFCCFLLSDKITLLSEFSQKNVGAESLQSRIWIFIPLTNYHREILW